MPSRNSKNVGIIGLGIIGQRVAASLRRRGFHVFVWNRTPRPVPNFLGSPAAIAEVCDFVQIFVSDDQALFEVIRQMEAALKAHHVIAAHSTVAPETMRMAATQVQRRGAKFLDAPFTGSKGAAEKGELVYYVAGDEAALQTVRTFLEASSKEIIEIGDIGQATTIKLATNIVTAATVQAASEALALVARSGISAQRLLTALGSNATQSATLAMKLPKIIQGNFEAHFSVKHMLKDVQLAGKIARSLDLDLSMTQAARDALLYAANSGRAEDDYSSVARQYLPEGISSSRQSEPEVQPDLIADLGVEIADSGSPRGESAPTGQEETTTESTGAKFAGSESRSPDANGANAAALQPSFWKRLLRRGTDY